MIYVVIVRYRFEKKISNFLYPSKRKGKREDEKAVAIENFFKFIPLS